MKVQAKADVTIRVSIKLPHPASPTATYEQLVETLKTEAVERVRGALVRASLDATSGPTAIEIGSVTLTREF